MTVRPIDEAQIARILMDARATRHKRFVHKHQRIGPPPLIEDLRDLIADIRDEPGSHIVVALLGFMAGAFGTLGLAWVYSAVLL